MTREDGRPVRFPPIASHGVTGFARNALLGICLLALSGCQYRGSMTLVGNAGAMDSLIAAARECDVRKLRIRRSESDPAAGVTRVHVGRVRVGSRADRAYACLNQWIDAHPELDIGHEILIALADRRSDRG